jgi:hypothetical protein
VLLSRVYALQIAKPFEWTFTRANLDRVLERIASHPPRLRLAA